MLTVEGIIFEQLFHGAKAVTSSKRDDHLPFFIVILQNRTFCTVISIVTARRAPLFLFAPFEKWMMDNDDGESALSH
jgi:hypothetical protein